MNFIIKIFILFAVVINTSDNSVAYETSTIRMALAYTAKEFCSCKFVMEQSDEFCFHYVYLSKRLKPKYFINNTKKEVTVRFAILVKKKAKFINDELGCVLTSLP